MSRLSVCRARCVRTSWLHVSACGAPGVRCTGNWNITRKTRLLWTHSQLQSTNTRSHRLPQCCDHVLWVLCHTAFGFVAVGMRGRVKCHSLQWTLLFWVMIAGCVRHTTLFLKIPIMMIIPYSKEGLSVSAKLASGIPGENCLLILCKLEPVIIF